MIRTEYQWDYHEKIKAKESCQCNFYYSRGGGSGGARGAKTPPNKIFNDAFFL